MAGYIIYSLDWERFRDLVERPTPEQLTALAKRIRDGLPDFEDECEEDDPILEWPSKVKPLTRIAANRLALPDWYGDLSEAGKNLWEGVIFGVCQDSDEIDVGFRVDSDGVYWDVIETAWKHLGVVPGAVTDVALSAFGTRPYRYHPRGGPRQTREEYDRELNDNRASLGALGDMLNKFMEDLKSGQKDPATMMEEIQKHQGVSQEHKNLFRELLDDDDSGDTEEDEDSPEGDGWSPMHSMHTPDEVQKMLAELRSAAPAMKAAKDGEVLRQYQEDLMPAIERVAADGRMLFIQVDT